MQHLRRTRNLSRFLPCSPHCKPQVHENKELNGDYDFYRPIIRLDVHEI